MAPRAPLSLAERATFTGLAAFVALMWLLILPLRPLFNPDEGRYAEIPREMLAGGDWIVPHLNGLPYIEKPPLQYWATALFLKLFGAHEFGARLYIALCAFGTVLVVWQLAKALWSPTVAWRAAAALASMQLFIVLGQLLTLDMSLTFYMTCALAAFLKAQLAADRRRERAWMLAAYLATALAVLTKGLVAAAIPVAVLALYSLLARDLGPWRRLHLTVGVPAFLLIVAPWVWLAARRLPDFLDFFVVHEHLDRYLTPSADREEVWWFFAPVAALGCIPWTLSALRVALRGGRARAPEGRFDPALFLFAWVAFILLFFSLSDSKLIPYIVPALPALALLIGELPGETLRRDVRRSAALTLGAAIALALLCHYAPPALGASERGAHFAALARPLIEVALLLAVSGAYVLAQRHASATRAALFLAAGWCLAGLLMMRAAAGVAPIYSGISLARALPAIPEGAALYSVATYDQTLPFYWRRTVLLVAYRGELDYGLRHDPKAELTSIPEFVERWMRQSSAYAVMERDMYEKLKQEGLPMREIAHDVRRVLVARQ